MFNHKGSGRQNDMPSRDKAHRQAAARSMFNKYNVTSAADWRNLTSDEQRETEEFFTGACGEILLKP